MEAELPPALLRPVEQAAASTRAVASSSRTRRLAFLNGDIVAIQTGGTLLDRDIVDELRKAGVAVQVIHPALVKANRRFWMPTLVGFLANFIEVFRRFEPGEIVLISHGIYRDVWLARWVWLALYRVRIVHFVYHFDFNLKRGFLQWIRRTIERLSLVGSELVFTISASSRAQAAELGVPLNCIQVIPVAQTRQPLREFPVRHRTGAPVFLFVGTVEPRKGLHVALEAMAQLPPDRHCELRIAGVNDPQSAYMQQLGRQAEQLSGCCVRFLGRISEAELEQQYTEADTFLFPSLWEGYGIAIEEALCYGLPIIATTAGSIPELVQDGREGWLVPPDDATALAAAIRECLNDPTERIERAKCALARAKQLAQRSTPGRVVRDVILALLNDRPRST